MTDDDVTRSGDETRLSGNDALDAGDRTYPLAPPIRAVAHSRSLDDLRPLP